MSMISKRESNQVPAAMGQCKKHVPPCKAATFIRWSSKPRKARVIVRKDILRRGH